MWRRFVYILSPDNGGSVACSESRACAERCLEEGPLGVREMRAVVRLSVIAGLCAVCDLNGSKERKRKERRRPAHRQFCGCLVLKSVRDLLFHRPQERRRAQHKLAVQES